MAVNYFLTLDGITGESQGADPKNWVEIAAFSHDMSQLTTASRSGGGGHDPVVRYAFTITMKQDASSPKLYQNLFVHLPRKLSIIFGNTNTKGAPSGPRLDVPGALITDIKPSSGTYITVTFAAAEYFYNGIRNFPLPHLLARTPGLVR